MRAPSTASLAATFRKAGEKEQRRVLDLICGLGPRGLDTLLRLWGEAPQPSVARWTAEGLACFDDREANAAVADALRSEFMSVRLHALRGIDANRRLDLLPLVIPLADDHSASVRMAAITALDRGGHGAARDLVEKALTDPSPHVAKRAKRLLEKRGASVEVHRVVILVSR